MKTNTIRVPYTEWVKQPFPQPKAFKLDEITKYIITDCPEEYVDQLKAQGIRIGVLTAGDMEVQSIQVPETVTFTFHVTTKPKKENPKKQFFDRKEVIERVKYYCELQRIACQMPLASLEVTGKITKQESDKICKLIREDADIFNIRNLEEEI